MRRTYMLAFLLALAVGSALADIGLVADLDGNYQNGPDTLQIEPGDTVLVRVWITGEGDSLVGFGITVGDTSGTLTWSEGDTDAVYTTPAAWMTVPVQVDEDGRLLLQGYDFSFIQPLHMPRQVAQLKFVAVSPESCAVFSWNPEMCGWQDWEFTDGAFESFEPAAVCVGGQQDSGQEGGTDGEDSAEGVDEENLDQGTTEALIAGIGDSAPYRFVENLGQMPSEVLYYLQGQGGSVYFQSSVVVTDLFLRRSPEQSGSPFDHRRLEAGPDDPIITRHAVIRATFTQASANRSMAAGTVLPGNAYYFIGDDPEEWSSNVRSYAGITYEDLYPGIDIVYKEVGGKLKYDVLVDPGADVGAIRIDYEGLDSIQVSEDGALKLYVDGAMLMEERPYIYQGSQEIEGGYLVRDDGTLGFDIPDYDAESPLVIDPGLIWSTYVGGSGAEEAWVVDFDPSGNVLVTGRTLSWDYPTSVGVYEDTTYGGQWDAFVSKLSADGDALIFSSYLGGSGTDGAYGLAVDGDGNVFLAGETASQDFPIIDSLEWDPGAGGGLDAFLVKLSPSGQLLYSTYYSYGDDEEAWDLALTEDGWVYVVGYTSSYPIERNRDTFVALFEPTGNPLRYDLDDETWLPGNGWDAAWGVAVNPSNRFHNLLRTIRAHAIWKNAWYMRMSRS